MKKSKFMGSSGLILILVLCSAFSLLISTISSADVPQIINIQGKLVGKDLKPVTGQQSLQVLLVDKTTNKAVFSDTFNTDLGSNGIFNINLGAGEAKLDNVDLNNAYNVNIIATLASGQAVNFTQALSSVPYALNSQKLGGKDAANFLDTSATTQIKLGKFTLSNSLIVFGGITASDTAGKVDGVSGSASNTNNAVKGVYKLKANSNAYDSDGAIGTMIDGFAVGVAGKTINGYGVYGKSYTLDGYSGYFTGGKGVYIDKDITLKGNIINDAGTILVAASPVVGAAPPTVDYVKKSGDNMTGTLGIALLNPNPPLYGLLANGETFGVFGNSTKGIGVSGKGIIGGGSFESTDGTGIYGFSNSGYSGYFKGGKGAKIEGDLDLSGNIKQNGKTGYYLDASDSTQGKAGMLAIGNWFAPDQSTGGLIVGGKENAISAFSQTTDKKSATIYSKNIGNGDGVESVAVAKEKSAVYAHHDGDVNNSGYGVYASSSNGTGVYGQGKVGISGQSSFGTGVSGISDTNNGVSGNSIHGVGVRGQSTDGIGVYASNSSGGTALQIGEGSFSMPVQSHAVTSVAGKWDILSTPTSGTPIGKINNFDGAPSNWYSEKNGLVKFTSTIIITNQNGMASYGPKNIHNGGFDIYVPAGSAVSYLVIN